MWTVIVLFGLMVTVSPQVIPSCTPCSTQPTGLIACQCGWKMQVLNRDLTGALTFTTMQCGSSVSVGGFIENRNFNVNMSEARSTYDIGQWNFMLTSCTMEIVLRDLRISYEETSFTPMIKCGAIEISSFPKMTLFSNTTCPYTTCSECSKHPGCGWCADGLGSCREGDTISDACHKCSVWSATMCTNPPPGCPNNCGGHGKCNNDTLKCDCDTPWVGLDCGTFNPPASCDNTKVRIFTVPLQLLNDQYVAGWPASSLYMAEIGLRLLSPMKAGTALRVRNRGQPFNNVYDYVATGKVATLPGDSCLPKSDLLYDIVITRPLHSIRSLWLSVNTTEALDQPAVEVTVVTCPTGFGGARCQSAIRHAEFLAGSGNDRQTPSLSASVSSSTSVVYEMTIPEFANKFVFGLESTSQSKELNLTAYCEWDSPVTVMGGSLSISYPVPCTYFTIVVSVASNTPTMVSLRGTINVCQSGKMGPQCNVDALAMMSSSDAFRFQMSPEGRRLIIIDVSRNTYALTIKVVSTSNVAVALSYGSPNLGTNPPPLQTTVMAQAPSQGLWFVDVKSSAAGVSDVGVEVIHALCDPTPCGSEHTQCNVIPYLVDYQVYVCACTPHYNFDPNASPPRCLADGSIYHSHSPAPNGPAPEPTALSEQGRSAIIVVAVAVAAGIALLAAIFYIRRRRRLRGMLVRDNDESEMPPKDDTTPTKA